MHKYILRAVTVILVVLFATSCAYPPEERYQNFLLDMDIVTRYDLSIDSVQQKRATQYTLDELRVLIDDVRSWDMDFADAEDANDNLINCANALIQSVELQQNDESEAAQAAFDTAIDFYQEAKAIIRKNMGNTSV